MKTSSRSHLRSLFAGLELFSPRGLAVRNLRPLFVGRAITLAGDGAKAWAADSDGALAVSAEIEW